MKKSLALLTLVVLVLTIMVMPLSADGKEKLVMGDPTPLANESIMELDAALMPSLADITEPMGILATITVYINEPCDDEWRAKYPSDWAYWANYAVEKADDMLYTWFGIDYASVMQNVWSSSSTTASGLLDEAKNEIGLTNGADIMVAFSGVSTGYGGLGYVGAPYCVVFAQSTSSDWKVARHETGHNYGLSHCTSNCIMNGTATMYSYADTICATHNTQWSNNKNKY